MAPRVDRLRVFGPRSRSTVMLVPKIRVRGGLGELVTLVIAGLGSGWASRGGGSCWTKGLSGTGGRLFLLDTVVLAWDRGACGLETL